MSSYNGEKYIVDQIESIMQQKSQHKIDLLIRDDGSKDHTCDAIEMLKQKYNSRIRLIKGENIGSNASFFTLIMMAAGYDFYAISDQDDVWLENKLDIAVNSLIQNDNAFNKPLLFASTSFLVHDDMIPFGKTREKLREFSLYNTIIQNICPGHTQVFNNSLLDLLKECIPDKVYVYDAWITNVAMLFGNIVFSNEAYTYYRQHMQNQLGYGKGRFGRLWVSFHHTLAGDGSKYKNQIVTFMSLYENELRRQKKYYAILEFISANSFWRRFIVCCKTPIYRQNRIETMFFLVSYLCGLF